MGEKLDYTTLKLDRRNIVKLPACRRDRSRNGISDGRAMQQLY